MTAALHPECTLTSVGPGVYEREASDVWLTHASLHGGYVLAVAVEAVTQELGGTGFELHHVALQYLRPFTVGSLRVEVSVERRGRRTASASLRLHSNGALGGVAIASAAAHRADDEADVALVGPPVVEPYDPAANDPSPSKVPIQSKVWMQPRIAAGDGPVPAQVGGWVAPRTPEVIDHRWLAVVADLWTPAVFRACDGPRSGSTVDISYHARTVLPRADLTPGSPVLVVLTNRRSSGGFVDEDVEVWSADGSLLAQTRQMRLVS
jgi:hypothetical protein